jgi:hypothetical protein
MACVATALLFGVTCVGDFDPIVGLDTSAHDRCTDGNSATVDASAAEIRCWVEDYLWRSAAHETVDPTPPLVEEG